nr:hypothetical protein [uncultured Allomuricauda sp.]
MIFGKSRIFFKGVIITGLLHLSCGSDDENGVGQSQSMEDINIAENTTETIVYISVDDFEIPVFLSIPDGCENKQLPAVVVMHGSNGMWANNDPESRTMSGQFTEWQSILAQNCIIGAFVDSYSVRGVLTRTGKWRELPDNFRISAQFERPKDANAALSLLQNLKYDNGNYVIRQDEIAILGFSDGATAVASTLMNTSGVPDSFKWTQSQEGKEYGFSDGVLPPQPKPQKGFAGGVFYYGGSVGYNYWGKHPCGDEAIESNVFYPYAPMLYNIPENGFLTENTLCMIDVLKEKGASVELSLYEDVGHGFDFDDVPQSTTARNNTIKWLKELWSNK